jgi:hypothetical protein
MIYPKKPTSCHIDARRCKLVERSWMQSLSGCKQDKVNNLITLLKLEQVDLK